MSTVFDTLKSLARVAVKSRPLQVKGADRRGRPLVVLGNGPSLAGAVADCLPLLREADTMAVNFAANTPEFELIKPAYYVLADPHFFDNPDDPNVARLLDNLRRVAWPMRLFVPFGKCRLQSEGHLTVVRYNAVKASGPGAGALYRRRLAMPAPRNVLIPSIMIGIWLGYKEIIIAGADHSWFRTLSVDDSNRVVSIQPHYYAPDEREENRIAQVYAGVRLHQVLESMAIAFAAYHDIARYAARRGVTVRNCTPGSCIDAFPRTDLAACLNTTPLP